MSSGEVGSSEWEHGQGPEFPALQSTLGLRGAWGPAWGRWVMGQPAQVEAGGQPQGPWQRCARLGGRMGTVGMGAQPGGLSTARFLQGLGQALRANPRAQNAAQAGCEWPSWAWAPRFRLRSASLHWGFCSEETS